MNTNPTHNPTTTPATPAGTSRGMSVVDTITTATMGTLGGIHPRLANSYAAAVNDAEHGEITVGTVIWASITILMAGGLGLIIWGKVKAKGNAIDLDAPTGIGN